MLCQNDITLHLLCADYVKMLMSLEQSRLSVKTARISGSLRTFPDNWRNVFVRTESLASQRSL